MPSIYASVTLNAIQVNNETNAEHRIQTNSSLKTTANHQATIRPQYLPFRIATISAPISKHLSTVAIVFIVLSVIAFWISLFALMYYIYRRWKRHKLPRPKPTSPITPSVALVDLGKRPGRPARHAQPNLHKFSPCRPPPSAAASSSLQCRKPLCEDYIRKLNLSEAYFAKHYDKCFCRKCHNPSTMDAKCGQRCKEFHGWIRFGLRLNEAHKKQWNIFKEWKTSYYGTSLDRLSSILSNRFIPLDGDQLANGTRFNSGHPDTTHCTTSPSIICASQPKFSVLSNFKAIDGNNYYVRVMLQCKQQADTIIVKGGAKSFQNVEWTTTARSSIVPFGLLIRLQKI
ncbi:unnamed protein product [Rotaria sp. Silwood2]|nr:unnamed protein product [Rotaria sp. Silwood2]CAF3115582.1 unnamed protein product [Rotaria sp. Silwood2]CAF4313154.1 unnamed protein product [Rotaria sp. Silwood2]